MTNRDEDTKPVRKWVYGEYGKIVYSDTERFRNEWEHSGGVAVGEGTAAKSGWVEACLTPRSIGWQEAVDEATAEGGINFKLDLELQDVQAKAEALEQTGILRSDDPHIIALAMLANVKVLVVQRTPRYTEQQRRGEDQEVADPKLQEDFKNLVGGSVYHYKKPSTLAG